MKHVSRLAGAVGALASAAALAALGAGVSVGDAGGPPAAHPAPAALASAASAGGRTHARSAGVSVPTRGDGRRLNGGTVYVAETVGAPPNYIFPMTSAAYCSPNNDYYLNYILHPPLYWFGNNYSPTVDYGQSMATRPAVSNDDRTYTIHLKRYAWSDGERVTADDLVFWMNMLKAHPLSEWCMAVPKLFPFNVRSYRAIGRSTFEITFKRSYNPTWVLYNELSQIDPMPLAWDRTSLSQPAPAHFGGSVGSTVAGAGRVYTFLNAQAKATARWARSPLWRVVDGPFRLQSFTGTGTATLVPNRRYSGSPKPSIAKLVELPFSSDSALLDEIKAAGPKAITIAGLPALDAPQAGAVASEGYGISRAASYAIGYLALNLHNPTLGAVFRQLYFRQALQHLINQPGWIRAILNGTGIPTFGPVPTAPASPLVSAAHGRNPYPFSVVAARELLARNGWKVAPGGVTRCVRPGTGRGECGAGIKRGEGISFTLDYESGVPTVASEMQDLQSKAKEAGIEISLESHSYNQVVATTDECSAAQSACGWQAANWGGGWNYGPDYLPTGEEMFAAGSVEDLSNYDNAKMTRLVDRTLTAPPARERGAMRAYARYAERQLPVVYQPASLDTFGSASAGTVTSRRLGGYTANAYGIITPQFWYLTR